MKGKSQLQFSQVNNKIYDKTRIVVKKKIQAKKKRTERIKPLWTKGSTKASPVTWDGEVPYSPFLFCQIPFTKKSLRELVLNNSINIMDKHISLTLLSIPSHQSSCVYWSTINYLFFCYFFYSSWAYI